MTNRIALGLALLIIAAIGADFALSGGSASLFLARKFLVILDWAMFWR